WCDQRITQLLRDFDSLVVRHERVAAEHIMRAALLGAAVCDDHGSLAFLMDLVGDLGVREHLDVDNIFYVNRPGRLRECGRQDQSRNNGKSQNVLHIYLSFLNQLMRRLTLSAFRTSASTGVRACAVSLTAGLPIPGGMPFSSPSAVLTNSE